MDADNRARAAMIYAQMIASRYPGRGMLRIAEAGEVASFKKSKAYMLVDQGVIPSVRIGSRRMVPVDRLIEWLIEQGEASDE